MSGKKESRKENITSPRRTVAVLPTWIQSMLQTQSMATCVLGSRRAEDVSVLLHKRRMISNVPPMSPHAPNHPHSMLDRLQVVQSSDSEFHHGKTFPRSSYRKWLPRSLNVYLLPRTVLISSSLSALFSFLCGPSCAVAPPRQRKKALKTVV